MSDSWAVRFVDNQVDRAWLDLRMRLADRFAECLANGGVEPIEISSATGETLTVTVDDAYVVVVAGDDVYTSDNVDEAANTVFRVLHDEWQVVHPSFLDTEFVDQSAVEDNPGGVRVPALGRATSKEELQSWVVATYSEGRSEPLKLDRNGDVAWRTSGGRRVTVKVRNAGRIELLTTLGRNVGFAKARKVIDELSVKYFGLKFFLVRDVLVMSQIVIAQPFVADQLHAALRTFISNTDDLVWVADKVLRNRVRTERDLAARAEAKAAAAEKARVEAEVALAAAESRVAELEGLEKLLKKALTKSQAPPHPSRTS